MWNTCFKTQVNCLQLAQAFAATIILKRSKSSSASDARAQLGWLSLEEIRSLHLRRLLHSIQNQNVTSYFYDLAKPNGDCHNYATRASANKCLVLNKVRANFGKSAISYRLAKLSLSY